MGLTPFPTSEKRMSAKRSLYLAMTVVAGLLMISPAYITLVLSRDVGVDTASAFAFSLVLFIVGLGLAFVALSRRVRTH